MNYHYFFLLFFAATQLMAQPTFNASAIPNVGTSVTSIEVPPSSINLTTTGANSNWNFSSIPTGGASSTGAYISPAGQAGVSNFPTANMAQISESSGGNQGVAYFQRDNNGLGLVGLYTFQQGNEIVIKYNSRLELYRAPFTFNSNYNAPITGVTETSGLSFPRNGTQSMVCDGYGTLTTPFGTFNDILRIKILQDYSDDIFGTEFDYLADITVWLRVSTGEFILTHTSFTAQGQTSLSANLSSVTVGVEELFGSDDLKIFPQPANDLLNLTIQSDKSQQVTLSISDLTGKKVINNTNLQLMSGEQTHNLDLSLLPSGLYLLSLNSGNKASHRIISVN